MPSFSVISTVACLSGSPPSLSGTSWTRPQRKHRRILHAGLIGAALKEAVLSMSINATMLQANVRHFAIVDDARLCLPPAQPPS